MNANLAVLIVLLSPFLTGGFVWNIISTRRIQAGQAPLKAHIIGILSGLGAAFGAFCLSGACLVPQPPEQHEGRVIMGAMGALILLVYAWRLRPQGGHKPTQRGAVIQALHTEFRIQPFNDGPVSGQQASQSTSNPISETANATALPSISVQHAPPINEGTACPKGEPPEPPAPLLLPAPTIAFNARPNSSALPLPERATKTDQPSSLPRADQSRHQSQASRDSKPKRPRSPWLHFKVVTKAITTYSERLKDLIDRIRSNTIPAWKILASAIAFGCLLRWMLSPQQPAGETLARVAGTLAFLSIPATWVFFWRTMAKRHIALGGAHSIGHLCGAVAGMVAALGTALATVTLILPHDPARGPSPTWLSVIGLLILSRYFVLLCRYQKEKPPLTNQLHDIPRALKGRTRWGALKYDLQQIWQQELNRNQAEAILKHRRQHARRMALGMSISDFLDYRPDSHIPFWYCIIIGAMVLLIAHDSPESLDPNPLLWLATILFMIVVSLFLLIPLAILIIPLAYISTLLEAWLRIALKMPYTPPASPSVDDTPKESTNHTGWILPLIIGWWIGKSWGNDDDK